ncbi:hypothetical protein P168DRAFT_150996 [Aspergillus campestris IBT 28561]|uniref:Uncharacterized protein n=1 Tax=Aspergillus campestris (strain IBT 28561) TaxID=1392248 RepID=A0A2I1D2G1_ASPC2|nr:uncharacterized protein P168DRAFT_150996 [Aspergillus campestris IBT 28561]PKY04046.1 hypothetical protein P168DRAFT_150996 [Aspergillus campestris IBT 28561]
MRIRQWQGQGWATACPSQTDRSKNRMINEKRTNRPNNYTLVSLLTLVCAPNRAFPQKKCLLFFFFFSLFLFPFLGQPGRLPSRSKAKWVRSNPKHRKNATGLIGRLEREAGVVSGDQAGSARMPREVKAVQDPLRRQRSSMSDEEIREPSSWVCREQRKKNNNEETNKEKNDKIRGASYVICYDGWRGFPPVDTYDSPFLSARAAVVGGYHIISYHIMIRIRA